MKKVLLLTTIGVVFSFFLTQGQNVFNPNDLNRRWRDSSAFHNDSTKLYADPNPGIPGLQKWVSVRTSGIDSSAWGKDFKAYFINVFGIQMSFRLKYPNSFQNPDSANKKYSLALFFHGAGEPGCPSNGGVYNNELQLAHGGQHFRNLVANNQFDGFLLYPQMTIGSGCWAQWGQAPFDSWYTAIWNMVDSLAKYARADIDRVIVYGLSSGGGAAWSVTSAYPQRVAKAAPSAAATNAVNYADFVHIPIWFASGGTDTNPNLAYAQATYNAIKNFGADIRWTIYPTLGHAVWNNHWNYPNHFPTNLQYVDSPQIIGQHQSWIQNMQNAHKANPVVYFQRYEFCPDSPINSRIGITAGFYEYEWQRNGVTIATRVNGVNTILDPNVVNSYNGHEMVVDSFGTYRVRFRRTSTAEFSSWSLKPAVISPKATTQTPPIAITGLKSKVLPAPDGSTTIPLNLPVGYSGYQWFRVSDNALVSTTNTYNAPVGQYRAKILEQFGCGSQFSPIFTVVNAAGSPKPDAAKNLAAFAISTSQIQLDWNENPNSGENETGFEIYRSTTAGGPYTLVHITAPNVITYTDNQLPDDTKFYYIVRAVGNFGAAANSNEANATTFVDNIAPTAPSNLITTCITRDKVNLAWTASTDNSTVPLVYDIYINGQKSYSTPNTKYYINELTPQQTLTFIVKARDGSGNVSQPSNQVIAQTRAQGLCYKVYQGDWDILPDFNTLTPVKEGMTANIDLSVRPAGVNDNFGFVWDGYFIPATTGTQYRFQTCSDDGSKMYFNMPYLHESTATVSNDGLHGTTCVNAGSNQSVTANTPYRVTLTFFEKTGGEAMQFNLSTSGSGGPFSQVVDARFTETYTGPGGTAPVAPSHLVAYATSHNRIELAWTDNSNNETGFEVTRATVINGTYVPVGTVAGTSFTDSNVVASTPYYYRVRAIGAFGQSATVGVEVDWQVNNNLTDANGNASRGLTATNTTFNAGDKVEGSHSISFNGTTAFLTVTNSTGGGFPSNGGYNKRSIGLWVKPTVVPTNGKVMWFDSGGPDNGIGLRTISTGGGDVPDLVAGIASGGTRDSIRLNDFTSNSNWIVGGWNHVDVVYAAPSFRLLLNGVEVASKTLAAAFNTIAANSSSSSRIGYPSTDNVFNDAQTSYLFYSGLMDDISINGMATTMPLPAAPNAPTGLTAQVVSKDNINLQWNDNSTNETGFEIYRSVGDNLDFRLIKTVTFGGATGTRNYSDTALFANITYYYKVRAIGPGLPSAYTNEVNATTQNTAPVISNVLDYAMKYGTVYNLPISATDEDGDPLSFIFDNLPSFISIQTINNGNIEVVYSPTIGDQGAYTTTVIVSDGHNGYDTTFYTLVVNDNTVPTLNPVNNVVMNEGANFTVPLAANDVEGNNFMVWSTTGMPSFGTFTDSGNGKASVRFTPGYSASGFYTMTVFVDDGNGSWASRTFNITVNEVDPNETFQINFQYFTGPISPLWNNINLFTQPKPFNVSNLRNTKGQVTTVGINALNDWYFASEAGVQTGNNSGVYSDTVMKDFMVWGFFSTGIGDSVRLRVRNLDPAKRYNFTFFASTGDNFGVLNAGSETKYRIGNEEAIVHPYLNTQETDTIYQVAPNGAGEIFITAIGNAAGNAGGLLNAMVIDGAFDDGTTPAKPLNLTGQFVENAGIRLQWVDRSYNEFSYRIYRATALGGPYTLLNPGDNNKDSVGYTDATAVQFTTYFYYVAGNNNHGDGASSDTISVTTENNQPVIANLNDIFVKTDGTANEDFTVTDHPSDVLTVSIANKPSFVTLTPMGGNNYRITVTPSFDNVGFYYLDVVAEDDKGGLTTRKVNVTVSDKNVRSIYVNFGQVGMNAPAPWNNFLHFGGAGSAIANLKDEAGVTTTIGLTHGNAWGGVILTGHLTGNNTGAYPDTVIRSGIWYNDVGARTITINGLDNSKRYNIVIFGSQNEGYDASARYTVNVGSQSDTLNARNNTNMTANINGLTPVGGAITLSLIKMASANFQFLNAMVLEEYTDPNLILNPVNLYVEPRDRTSTVLTWSDRTDNEDLADGFQLQRASDSLFTSILQTVSLGRNVTTFTNTGLNPNTKYWYRIRAKKGGLFSDWSNRVKTITPNSRVYVNFNYVVQSAAIPWNNFESLPNLGTTLSNLMNYTGAPTGFNLQITIPFNGENNAGMPTSNMFGVPNQVTQSSYWIDNTQISQMKLSGLNLTKRYRIGFISSSNWVGGDLTTTLSINGRKVYINAWQNTTKIVSIGNLVPDSNGEMLLDFSTTDAAGNGYNSGLIIDSYDDVNGGGVLNAPNNNDLNRNVVFEQGDARPTTIVNEELDARIYPNPFRDVVNIDFYNRAGTKATMVEVFDVTGRLVMRQQYSSLPEGYNTIRLSTPQGKLETGVYMLTLKVDGKVVKTGKLIKAK